MSYPVETDTIRRVQNEDGYTLDIRPWPDAPDTTVALMNSSSNTSKKYFGTIEVVMNTEFARQIGEALIQCADELDESKNT